MARKVKPTIWSIENIYLFFLQKKTSLKKVIKIEKFKVITFPNK